MVTITLGRHGIMDENAGITPLSMLAAYFSGKDLLQYGPALVLSSSVKRAEITAQIRNLVLRAPLLFLPELHDNPDLDCMSSAQLKDFVEKLYGQIVFHGRERKVQHVHVITHLPILLELTGDFCSECGYYVIRAENWDKMQDKLLKRNFIPEEIIVRCESYQSILNGKGFFCADYPSFAEWIKTLAP